MLITIKSFADPADAQLLKVKLENEGIKCILSDEHFASASACQAAIGGTKLKIYENDVSTVAELLKEIDNTPFTDDTGKVLSCPNCRSNDIYSDFKSVSGVKGLSSLLSNIFLPIFPFYWKSSYLCKQCNTKFKR